MPAPLAPSSATISPLRTLSSTPCSAPIQALHGVDLDVAKGEIVTLIGANGAGKSTLLMTICGSPRARAGTIRLEGEDISRLATHEIVRRGVAQVPEGRRIFRA